MAEEIPQIKEVHESLVICKRERGNYDETISRFIRELIEEIKTKGGRIAGPPMLICHDSAYREADADIEVAIPIESEFTVDLEGAMIKKLPAIRAISLLHKGSYSKIEESYSKIEEFAKEKGYELTQPIRELYLNHPEESKETEFLTEIIYPVE